MRKILQISLISIILLMSVLFAGCVSEPVDKQTDIIPTDTPALIVPEIPEEIPAPIVPEIPEEIPAPTVPEIPEEIPAPTVPEISEEIPAPTVPEISEEISAPTETYYYINKESGIVHIEGCSYIKNPENFLKVTDISTYKKCSRCW